MDLLPRSHREFQSSEYWNSFFKKRGNKAFEWYGEFPQLCAVLMKYVKPQERMLMVGCGNSQLSADMYDVGYVTQDNIDISDTVIKQMLDKNRSRPQMNFAKMDVTQMSFEDGRFAAAIDKGTLDALLVDDSAEVKSTVTKMLEEVGRVLSLGGRYVCISLLQDRVLQTLLQHFADLCWCIRVHPIPLEPQGDSDFSLPVFAVVVTKFKKLPNMKPIVEVSGHVEKMERLAGIAELKDIVKEMQYYAMIRQQISKTRGRATDDLPPVCLYSKVLDSPRYTLHIVDSPTACAKKFAIFITPQGGETEWLFCTAVGRRSLAQQAGFERLVVVVLDRHHQYGSLADVQAELNNKVMELAPPSYTPGTQVPYLSRGGDLGKREAVGRGHSELSGDYVVEDVDSEGTTFRRLVFLNSPNIVQSESRLKQASTKKGKKKGKLVVDKSYLSCQFHVAMTAGLAALKDFQATMDEGVSVLLLGLGGGCLPVFLQDHFPKLSLEVVDIDGAMVEVAKEHFAFQPGPRLQVQVADGLDVVRQKAEEGAHYNVVMFDVDSKDLSKGLSCPPSAFLELDFLQTTARLLQDGGVFILNLVCRDEDLRKSSIEKVQSVFKTVVSLKIEEDVNEICFACLDERDRSSTLEAVVKAMNVVKTRIDKMTTKRDVDLCEAFGKLLRPKSS